MNEFINKSSSEELQKIAEEHKHCSQIIAELNTKLVRVNEKLKEAEEMKSHFISNIMNEIINPFASILGLSQNIMSLKEGEVDKAISIAHLIYNEANHLDFQLNNIFIAAKIEAGEISPNIQRVDLKNLIESVISNFGIEANKKEVRIDFSLKDGREKHDVTYFKTDPEKIRTIVSNILSNAIKFSDKDQGISIQAIVNDKSLMISMKDKGKGIDENSLQDIFDRFKQLDTTIHTLNSGYGLGLSITAALVDILDGDIQVKSQVGEGCEFIIILPESEASGNDISPDINEIFFNDEVF